jgi:hypothetical protein
LNTGAAQSNNRMEPSRPMSLKSCRRGARLIRNVRPLDARESDCTRASVAGQAWPLSKITAAAGFVC